MAVDFTSNLDRRVAITGTTFEVVAELPVLNRNPVAPTVSAGQIRGLFNGRRGNLRFGSRRRGGERGDNGWSGRRFTETELRGIVDYDGPMKRAQLFRDVFDGFRGNELAHAAQGVEDALSVPLLLDGLEQYIGFDDAAAIEFLWPVDSGVRRGEDIRFKGWGETNT